MKLLKDVSIWLFGLTLFLIGIRYIDLVNEGWKGYFILIFGILVLYYQFIILKLRIDYLENPSEQNKKKEV